MLHRKIGRTIYNYNKRTKKERLLHAQPCFITIDFRGWRGGPVGPVIDVTDSRSEPGNTRLS